MTETPLARWLERLESLHPREIDLGLERIREVAQRLGLLTPAFRVITVAGTNGKGSTVAVMERVLLAGGCRVGASTSPHLLRFNERIRIGGCDACDDDIVAAFEAIDSARGDTSLTYFEFGTLAALWLFARAGVEVALLEVGLGGRLDAANVVDADVAVITSIDLDHQQWLGDDRDTIALEKAGILRPGIPVVVAEPDPPDSLRHRLAGHDGPVLQIGRDFEAATTASGEQRFTLSAAGAQFAVGPIAAHGVLPGNVGAGLQALLAAGFELSGDRLEQVLEGLVVAGRRQRRELGGREYLLDVAHNPAAVRALAGELTQTRTAGRSLALFAPMADKDIGSMLDACAGCFDAWFLADQPRIARASRGADNAGLLRERGCGMISVSKNVRQAFRRAQGLMGEGDRLVVFGSFFPVAEIMALLDRDDGRGATGG